MAGLSFLQDLAIVMVVAGLAGWICQRIGLSSVVGFLLAGILMGPYTPPFALVSDMDRIHTLSQLGLVFLMFSVGMGLSIRRLQRMGAATLVATAIGALLVLAAGRSAGMLIGWTPLQSLFLAALLMTSSSAIIGKVLHEIGATHEPASRRAMAITVQEDVVAVIMLTVLTSATAVGGAEAGASIWQTLGLILLFVIVLVIAGLLLVPRLLAQLARTADVDLQTILIAGLVLGCALLAVRAGYSLALGAFLLGAIVAVTPQRAQVERYLQGLRDIFTAVFFVSIGMLMDIRVVSESWPLVLGFGIFTVILRSAVCTAGLILIGNPTKDAVRSGVMLTPIGEFSFIIAQLGVSTGGAPALIYPLAVGIALFTALTAPFLIKHSSQISDGIERLEPKFFKELVLLYHGSLEKIQMRREGNLVWQLSRRPITQVFLWFLFVTGLLAFSRSISDALFDRYGGATVLGEVWNLAFWSVLGLIVLAPVVAIWRNLAALAAIYAEALTRGAQPGDTMRGGIQTALNTVFGFMMAIWLWLLVPLERAAIWTAAAVLMLVAILLLLLRRRLTLLHSKVESQLHAALQGGDAPSSGYGHLVSPHQKWDIHVHDVVLPDQAACAGKSLSELELRRQFGCSVAGVERHGYAIPNPPPDLVLYPGDKLLLLATPNQMESVRNFIGKTRPADEKTTLAEEIEMEGIRVPEKSHAAGKMLVELDIPAATGVQIVGIERDGNRVLNPGPFQGIEQGDQLLAFGTHRQIQDFERWLSIERAE